MSLLAPRPLGRTGIAVGRLGLASSYGAPAAAFEEGFERGCNYFVWGSFVKGRLKGMRQAIQHLVAAGQRDHLVIALHSYWHSAVLMRGSVERALRALGTDHLDVLLLGYYPRRPAQRVIDRALELKAAGLTRAIGLTGHNRRLFPKLLKEDGLDVWHVRYNAANRGAEEEVFPPLERTPAPARPGVVIFTATRWGQLLQQKRMPDATAPPTAADCYRFVLSHPMVDVCLTGPKTAAELRQTLDLMEQGPLDDEELRRLRTIGDHVYGRRPPAT